MLNIIGQLKDKVTGYFETRIQLVKLSFIEKTSNVLSYLIFTLLMLFLSLAIFVFLGLGMSEYFNELTGSRTQAYFITTGVYLVLVILLVVLRANIVNAFSGMFIRILTEGDDKDEEDEADKIS